MRLAAVVAAVVAAAVAAVVVTVLAVVVAVAVVAAVVHPAVVVPHLLAMVALATTRRVGEAHCCLSQRESTPLLLHAMWLDEVPQPMLIVLRFNVLRPEIH
jgi:hypothetical protein